MSQYKRLPSPPDDQVTSALLERFPRAGWQKKSGIETCVNRTNWPKQGYSYPTWYQIRRCLRALIKHEIVEYKFLERGEFKAHTYRWVEKENNQ